MSGVAVINSILSNDAGVTAVVPAEGIVTGDNLPMAAVLPAISVKQISGVERLTVAMTETKKQRSERVQVTVHSKAYAQVKSILELVRTACVGKRGVIAGISVDGITPDGEGPDLSDPASQIIEQSRDFLVKWIS